MYPSQRRESTHQLSHAWTDRIQRQDKKWGTIDVQDGLSLATLEAIGFASFDYDFDCIANPDQEVTNAYRGFL